MSQLENENINLEVYQDFIRFFTFTEDDSERQPTDDELKELCLRTDCKVMMSRWNPVDDVARALRRKGRLRNKTKQQVNRFLEKCVNHYKESLLYSEAEIEATLLEGWRRRKKFSLLLLDLWEYDRQNNHGESQPPYESQANQNETHQNTLGENNEVVNAFLELNTESMLINTEDRTLQQLTLEVPFTQGTHSHYDEFNCSMPCTSTQDKA